jgi:hypothetical protein
MPEELPASADTHASRDAPAAAENNVFMSGGLNEADSKAEMSYRRRMTRCKRERQPQI